MKLRRAGCPRLGGEAEFGLCERSLASPVRHTGRASSCLARTSSACFLGSATMSISVLRPPTRWSKLSVHGCAVPPVSVGLPLR
jgi:hypothetical protein